MIFSLYWLSISSEALERTLSTKPLSPSNYYVSKLIPLLEVAHMGAHCLQMMGMGQLEDIFDMVTSRGAQVMQLDGYGVEVGNPANCIILQARTILDAIRLKPARLAVFRHGNIIARTPKVKSAVKYDGQTKDICFEDWRT